jgi:hypothetical protein
LKKLYWIARIIIIGLIIGFNISPALASDTAVINIIATPSVTVGISGFTLTYISDTNIEINWGYTPDFDHIMIRAKYGEYPAGITDNTTTPSDGYLVYYGTGTSTNDTSMDFDENAGTLYYSAWAWSPTLGWSIFPLTGNKESEVVRFIAFLILPLVLTGIAVACKRTFLFVGASFAWGLLSFWAYSQHLIEWDIYFLLFWFCIAMVIVMLIEAINIYFDERRKEKKLDATMAKEELREDKKEKNEMKEYGAADKLRIKHGLSPSASRERRNNSFRSGW